MPKRIRFREICRLACLTKSIHQSELLARPITNPRCAAPFQEGFASELARWAFGETHESVFSEEVSAAHLEPTSDESFEDTVLLEDFLSQLQRAGVLSPEECDLVRKFKCEGFQANELVGSNAGNTTNAVQTRLKRIIKRLRHANSGGQIAA